MRVFETKNGTLINPNYVFYVNTDFRWSTPVVIWTFLHDKELSLEYDNKGEAFNELKRFKEFVYSPTGY